MAQKSAPSDYAEALLLQSDALTGGQQGCSVLTVYQALCQVFLTPHYIYSSEQSWEVAP